MQRVLVVDDVPVVRLVIAKILAKAGYNVAEAGDGAEAMAHLNRVGADAVVTDIWMPGTDGLDLIHSIRAGFPKAAVVAMTGGSPQANLQETRNRVHQAGVSVILMKPIDKTELVEAVQGVLAAR